MFNRLDDLLTRVLGDGELPEDAASPPFWQAFMLAALGLAFKAPDSLWLPQFWAEDATIFFAQQHWDWWPLLFEPYASYLHTVPRVVAWLFRGLAPASAPTAYCWAAWLSGSLALVSLRQLRLGGVPYWALLAGVILAPTGGEVFGSITNLQWLSQLYLVAILARLARGDVALAPRFRLALTFVLGLTGPFSIFAALMGWVIVLGSRLLSRRFARLAPVPWNVELVVLSFTALVQLLYIRFSHSPGGEPHEPPTVDSALSLLSYAEQHTFGSQPIPPGAFWLLFAVIIVLALVLVQTLHERYTILALLGFGGLQLAAAVHKLAFVHERLVTLDAGDRYFLVLKTIFFWLLAVAAWLSTRRSRRLQHVVMLSLLLLPLPFSWPTLQRPALPDLHWREQAVKIDVKKVSIDIAPFFRLKLKPRKPATPRK